MPTFRELPPRFASPVMTVDNAYMMFARFGISQPVCGDGNATLRANPELMARMMVPAND